MIVSEFDRLFYLCFRTDYFRNFIDSCLQKNPQDRPHSDDMLGVSEAHTHILYTATQEQQEGGQCVKMGGCADKSLFGVF